MKKNTTLILILIITSFVTQVYAQEYSLIRHTEGAAQEVSENEILEMLGTTYQKLSHFKCDNPERFRIFGQDSNFNKKNALRLIGQDNKKYIYKSKKLIDEKTKKKITLESMIDKRTGKVSDSFTYLTLKALHKLESRKLGKKLIRKMQASPYVFYIAFGGNNVRGTDATLSKDKLQTYDQRVQNQFSNFQAISLIDDKIKGVEKIVFNKIGGYGTINFHPQDRLEFVDTLYKKSSNEPYITLAHEMYHAYDAARGLLDMRIPRFENSHAHQPMTNIVEHRAVRFANLLRAKKKRRRFYSDVSQYTTDQLRSFKSMLNKDGSPIIMPTPCVGWL